MAEWLLRVRASSELTGRTVTGVLIGVIPKESDPDPGLITKYYGKDTDPVYYCSMKYDRAVILKEDGKYAVITLHPKVSLSYDG